VVQHVWDLCDRWIGKVGVRHQATLVNIQSFCLLDEKQSANRALKGLWVAIVSEVWSHRNKVVFKGGVVDAIEIFSLAQLKGWLWAKYKMKRITFSYSDCILSPVQCLQSLAYLLLRYGWVVPSLFAHGLYVSVLLCSLLPGYWLCSVLGALVPGFWSS